MKDPRVTKIEEATQKVKRATQKAIEAIKNGAPNSLGALEDCLEVFKTELKKFEIDCPDKLDDDAIKNIIKSIEETADYRNEFVKLISTLAKYNVAKEYFKFIRDFFESETIIRYLTSPGWCHDNLKFLLHELFLCTIAILIKRGKFQQATLFLVEPYHIPENEYICGGGRLSNFSIFNPEIKSLKRKSDIEYGEIYTGNPVQANLLIERCNSTGEIQKRHLIQTDFILLVRTVLMAPRKEKKSKSLLIKKWYPQTLSYFDECEFPFEIFIRAESKDYFNEMKCLLGIDEISQLTEFIKKSNQEKEQKRESPEAKLKNPGKILNISRLASR